MKLPKKITPCPISEAIVEIRFESPFPPDAIYGIVYQAFKEDFPKTQNLPILQLPEPIRLQDPMLKFKPYYKLTNTGFIFHIGPKMCALISPKEYVGWIKFSEKIQDCFGRILDLGIIDKVIRLGIRYINFFEKENIFNKINLKTIMGDKDFGEDNEMDIKTSIKSGEFTSNLKISNNAFLTEGDAIKQGSVIDIDVLSSEFSQDNSIGAIKTLLEKGHQTEKELFFSLFGGEFLKTLNPEY